MTIHLNTAEATRIAERYFSDRNDEQVDCVIDLPTPPTTSPSNDESTIDNFLFIVMSMKNCGNFDGNKIRLIKILRGLSPHASLSDYKHAIELRYEAAIAYYREHSNFMHISEGVS